MTTLLQIASAVSVVAIFVIATIIKSYKGGYLGNVVQRYRENNTQMNSKLEDIQATIEKTHHEAQSNGKHIADLEEAVFLLHRDDEQINESELREKVGVDETGTDIFDD